MSEELLDEITSINSIYGNDTLTQLSNGSELDYPDTPPSILGTQHTGADVAKGEGTYLVDLVRDVLAEVYTPGAPCVFDLVEDSAIRLQQLGLDQSAPDTESKDAQGNGQDEPASVNQGAYSDDQQHVEELGDAPPWTLSEVISEKKSVFIARAAAVTSIDQARQYLQNLLATDKKVAKATHNITAWRIRGGNGVQYQDCDDDGETAAGGRLLHLLELMGAWDAMVVVTRWYGGVQLGPDRFRIINQTARDALVSGGLAPDGGKESGKKKGKK